MSETDPDRVPTTIPGPPKLPSDLGSYPDKPFEETAPGYQSDRDKANWDIVRAALVASAEASARVEKVVSEGFEKERTARIEEAKALTLMLNGRFDAEADAREQLETMLKRRFDAVDRAQIEAGGLLAELNKIVAGLRSFSRSLYDMIKSVRAGNPLPELEDEQLEQAAASSDSAGMRAARAVR